MSNNAWFWLILGVILILIEFFVPGLVVIFLGIGALFVALLQWTGVLDSWTASLSTWFISSFIFLICLRGVSKKFLPGEVSKGELDEDEEAFGAIVDVLDTVSWNNNDGRIRFRGTSWSAKCIDGKIKAGEKAKIVFRNDMIWVVEEVLPLPDDDEDGLLE